MTLNCYKNKTQSGIAVLIFSLVILVVSFFATMTLTVFLPINPTSEALCIVLTYLPCVLYLNSKCNLRIVDDLKQPLLLKYALIGIVVIVVSSYILSYFNDDIIFKFGIHVDNSKGLIVIPYLFFALLVIPVCEELIFRQGFYHILKNRFGVIAGTILSTLFFVAVHFNHPHIFAIVLQSLLFTYVYEKSKSISSSIIVHSFNNALWHFIAYIASAR